MQRRVLVGVVCATVVALSFATQAAYQAGSSSSAIDGERLLDKLIEISANASAKTAARPVIIYQREINAYLRFQAASEFPEGVTDPDVALRSGGAVSLGATVDLSVIRDARARGPLDPLRYLGGRLPVSANGLVRTLNGIGRVDIESVSIGGVPMPSSVLSELVRYYSRSDQNPDGIDVSEPFELPYGVTELRIEHEQVVVVQ